MNLSSMISLLFNQNWMDGKFETPAPLCWVNAVYKQCHATPLIFSHGENQFVLISACFKPIRRLTITSRSLVQLLSLFTSFSVFFSSFFVSTAFLTDPFSSLLFLFQFAFLEISFLFLAICSVAGPDVVMREYGLGCPKSEIVKRFGKTVSESMLDRRDWFANRVLLTDESIFKYGKHTVGLFLI